VQAEELFRVAFGFGEQWEVVDTDLDVESKRLDVRLDFVRGARFPCLVCERSCGARDTKVKTWRHLDFVQYSLYLTAPLPRVACPEHGVKQIKAEWARPWSGFTLLFEALVMMMVREMPVNSVAGFSGRPTCGCGVWWSTMSMKRSRPRISAALSGSGLMTRAAVAGTTM
jgi:transposase